MPLLPLLAPPFQLPLLLTRQADMVFALLVERDRYQIPFCWTVEGFLVSSFLGPVFRSHQATGQIRLYIISQLEATTYLESTTLRLPAAMGDKGLGAVAQSTPRSPQLTRWKLSFSEDRPLGAKEPHARRPRSLPAVEHFRCVCLGALWIRTLTPEGSWPDPFLKGLCRLAFQLKWYPESCQCSLTDVVGPASLASLPNMHDLDMHRSSRIPTLTVCTG